MMENSSRSLLGVKLEPSTSSEAFHIPTLHYTASQRRRPRRESSSPRNLQITRDTEENSKFHNLYNYPDILGVIKSWRVRFVCVCVGGRWQVHTEFVREPEI